MAKQVNVNIVRREFKVGGRRRVFSVTKPGSNLVNPLYEEHLTDDERHLDSSQINYWNSKQNAIDTNLLTLLQVMLGDINLDGNIHNIDFNRSPIVLDFKGVN